MNDPKDTVPPSQAYKDVTNASVKAGREFIPLFGTIFRIADGVRNKELPLHRRFVKVASGTSGILFNALIITIPLHKNEWLVAFAGGPLRGVSMGGYLYEKYCVTKHLVKKHIIKK